MREVKIIPIENYVETDPNEDLVIIPYRDEDEITKWVRIARSMMPDRITIDRRVER